MFSKKNASLHSKIETSVNTQPIHKIQYIRVIKMSIQQASHRITVFPLIEAGSQIQAGSLI